MRNVTGASSMRRTGDTGGAMVTPPAGGVATEVTWAAVARTRRVTGAAVETIFGAAITSVARMGRLPIMRKPPDVAAPGGWICAAFFVMAADAAALVK